jgi:amidophosphoribosyltransferase
MQDLFYGTDYHSHLGTKRGGLTVRDLSGLRNVIHNIENSQFRSKFEEDIPKLQGREGIGVISDYDDQPLIIGSHLGTYSIVTVGRINNSEVLAGEASARGIHFSEMSGGMINPTELVASLVNEGSSYSEGISNALNKIEGSCSLLLLTDEGLYAARDRLGRTPVVLGVKEGSRTAAMESCAFTNLGFSIDRYLGPGEVVRITRAGVEQKNPPGTKLQICAFLWVYYGYPASSYEGINVEDARNRCGAFLARRDDIELDVVAGIPDSGTAHAIGYATEAGVPYRRPFVKYTPTWARSFMPQDQETREVVAKMKLIPVPELIKGRRLLFADDSIVRGTQLKDTIRRLYEAGAKEVHMRPACPPLVYGCKFLNFSRSRSEFDLAARSAIRDIEGDRPESISDYTCYGSEKYLKMVECIRERLKLTSLKYQKMEDLIEAIGLPRNRLCTYCWDGVE